MNTVVALVTTAAEQYGALSVAQAREAGLTPRAQRLAIDQGTTTGASSSR